MDTFTTLAERFRPTLDLAREVLSREVTSETFGDPVLWLFKPQVMQMARGRVWSWSNGRRGWSRRRE